MEERIELTSQEWTEVIRSRRGLLDLRLKEVVEYRDLLIMFVKRDFIATYQQTILGPLWFFIQPVLTTIMFTLVFGNIAGLSTDGQPKLIFYLSGLVIWNYFSDVFNRTSSVFVANAGVFGKVYFPRLITPLSIIASGLMRFGIQMLLFIAIWAYYLVTQPGVLHPNISIMLVPFLVLLMAGFALGAGMIISSLTTKYRDLGMLVSFGVSLLMYATPVIYPLNSVPDAYRYIVLANPLAPIVESFRFAFLGSGALSPAGLAYSFVVMLIVLVSGIIIFNKVEQSFMDTV